MSHTSIERSDISFRGGEQRGQAIAPYDIVQHLVDALQTDRYGRLRRRAKSPGRDRTYADNQSFWTDALSAEHFPGANIILENFHLTEWLPFAPGRYFDQNASAQRDLAAKFIARDRDEYTPEGKASMVRGGIGSLRLAEKKVGGALTYFLGASSNGIAHQGIPIALPADAYSSVMPVIKEHGGCCTKLVGTLQSVTDEYPQLYWGSAVPRYCYLADEAIFKRTSAASELLTTVAIMFSLDKEPNERWYSQENNDPTTVDKSWSFCSFNPSTSRLNPQNAANWLFDYAKRYSRIEPKILTDFDEHYRLFDATVEFPVADIVRGKADWERLGAYKQLYKKLYGDTYVTYIETYVREHTTVEGDKIDVHGSGVTIVNRSSVNNAFNRVAASHDEQTANALRQIEAEINKSGNKGAAENFESFSDELSKPEPKKSLLKSLWQGTLEALPTLKELPGVIAKIAALFA